MQEYYQDGTPINDIRAALYAVDLMAEQFGVIEIFNEVAKSMSAKVTANADSGVGEIARSFTVNRESVIRY